MTPTIRVDDEVYEWLKSNAVPFDDTPNSVLRRLAGLDSKKPVSEHLNAGVARAIRQETDSVGRRTPLANGPDLLRRWRIPAVQAKFHRDGRWYAHLDRFPGALCDPNGFVVFESESAYRNSPHLKLGKQVNVPRTISSIPEYRRSDDPIGE